VAVGKGGFFDDGDDGAPLGDREEATPVAQRLLMRCLPCLGEGRVRVLDAARETIRPCPVCRGVGMRIILFRGQREVSVAEEKEAMKVADLGRCKGAFRAGRRAAFGRVACLECGRFRPLPGMRVPNHIAQRAPKADSAEADSAEPESAEPDLPKDGA